MLWDFFNSFNSFCFFSKSFCILLYLLFNISILKSSSLFLFSNESIIWFFFINSDFKFSILFCDLAKSFCIFERDFFKFWFSSVIYSSEIELAVFICLFFEVAFIFLKSFNKSGNDILNELILLKLNIYLYLLSFFLFWFDENDLGFNLLSLFSSFFIFF